MITKYPKITVIIPQKNRSEYLKYTLRTCMMQDYPNFEVIVSDDCSEDDSVNIVNSLIEVDSRIKLFAHNHHLGMRDNFEFALNQVKEGFIMALGGDDGLLPESIWDIYKLIIDTGSPLITWAPATFVYSDKENCPNILSVPRKKHCVRTIKSEDFLNKLAKTFQYQIDECPMFYMKGVASIELINRVKARSKDNCFYNCPTPDGFSGVVLAGEVDEYIYTTKPLSIVGSTKKSQGIIYGKSDDRSRKEANQFFNDNIRITMHKELASQPYSPLTSLMTADYLLTARDLKGWPGKFEMFSIKSLLKAIFKQLESTPYENTVLNRELEIVKNIAVYHNLEDYFNELFEKSKRRYKKSLVVYGFAITNSIRFNGNDLNINNIYEASLCVPFLNEIQNFGIRPLIGQLLRNTFKLAYRLSFSKSKKLSSVITLNK